jgi:hypothetical protein
MGHNMSKEKTSQRDGNEDPRKKVVNNNPCGICRAMGMPVCKGHGGGSGGGSSDSNGAKQQAESQPSSGSIPLNSPMLKPKNDALFNSLGHNPLWIQVDEFIFQYKSPYGLLSMTLNMENNTLTCQGRDDLTQKEQYALDAHFKAIEHELNTFKKEFSKTHPMQASMSRIGNQMTIQISDPKCFDAFIQRLADKNLLVLTNKNLLQAQPDFAQKGIKSAEIVRLEPEQSASSWTAPTPFNKTPKPKK